MSEVGAFDRDTASAEDTNSMKEKPEDARVATQALSKSAQKRAAKTAFLAEKKLERRAREKAARKEKKKQKREAGESWYEDEEPSKKKLKRAGPAQPFNARVVVDLGFDDMMTDKVHIHSHKSIRKADTSSLDQEIVSLASQLAYTYSANRHAAHPFSSLLFTSLHGRLHTKLEKQNEASYKRWDKTEWWE